MCFVDWHILARALLLCWWKRAAACQAQAQALQPRDASTMTGLPGHRRGFVLLKQTRSRVCSISIALKLLAENESFSLWWGLWCKKIYSPNEPGDANKGPECESQCLVRDHDASFMVLCPAIKISRTQTHRHTHNPCSYTKSLFIYVLLWETCITTAPEQHVYFVTHAETHQTLKNCRIRKKNTFNSFIRPDNMTLFT